MSENSTGFENTSEQWAAYQKIWAETLTRMMEAGFSFSPESAPPEFARRIRSGIFEALSQSWDEFLRSPQFLEGMKQWMESATSFRKMTTDFLTKAQHETQSPAREDIDNVLLSMRQVESRILDRLEDLSNELGALKSRKKPSGSRVAARRQPKGKTGKRNRK